MNPKIFESALSKVNDEKLSEIIQEMVILQNGITALKNSQVKLIKAFQIVRGEKGPRYSKSKQIEINEYADDAAKMDADQVILAIENPSPVSIIGTMYAGLAPALRGDYLMKKVLKNEDLIVVELIEKMETSLLRKMELFLNENNGQEYLELGKRN